MWSLLVILLLTGVKASIKQFIVNGGEVDISNFPWQGSFKNEIGSHTCGCVFVGGEWALTAGHCGGSTTYSMMFGSTLRESGPGPVFGISSITRHPDYGIGPGYRAKDISVVQANTIISGNNISPASIPDNSNHPGGSGWITGWGRTCGGCPVQLYLHGAEVSVISDESCQGSYGNDFQSDSMICVGGNNTGGSCYGDGGGPLTKENILYGVSSWQTADCITEFPSVYCRIGAFKGWICGQTQNGAEGC